MTILISLTIQPTDFFLKLCETYESVCIVGKHTTAHTLDHQILIDTKRETQIIRTAYSKTYVPRSILAIDDNLDDDKYSRNVIKLYILFHISKRKYLTHENQWIKCEFYLIE